MIFSNSSKANDGLNSLFNDDKTKYNSFFLICANCIPFTSYSHKIKLKHNKLTKNGVYLNSLSSLKEFVIPTLSKNMS